MEVPYKIQSDEIKIYGAMNYDHKYNKIFTSAWSTLNGEFGQFLVNYTTEPIECIIDLPEKESFKVYEEYDKPLMSITGRSAISLKRLSAVLIEKIK